jgi:hypothetical protein
MKYKILGAIALSLAALVESQASAQDVEVPPSDDFKGLLYAVNSKSEIFVFAALRDVGGMVGVCGLVWTNDATNSAKFLEPKFTKKMRFSVSGQKLVVNTQKFNRFASREEANDGMAGCAVTKTAWQAAYASASLEMDLPSTTVYD